MAWKAIYNLTDSLWHRFPSLMILTKHDRENHQMKPRIKLAQQIASRSLLSALCPHSVTKT